MHTDGNKKIVSISFVLIILIIMVIIIPFVLIYEDEENINTSSLYLNQYNNTIDTIESFTIHDDIEKHSAFLSINSDKNNITIRSLQIYQNFTYNDDNNDTLCQNKYECSIACIGGNIPDVVRSIKNITMEKDSNCTGSYKLRLFKTQFVNNTITKGWLSSLKNISIELLTIAKTDLKELGSASFSGIPFNKSLLNLSLVETKICHLNKQSFDGSLLSSFAFEFSALGQSVDVEEDLLNDTAQYIEYISFNYALNNVESLKNLSGKASSFSKLQALNLSYNSLTMIPNTLFLNSPNLISLNLSYCGIQEINDNTFNNLRKLQLLDISNNDLETLKESLFFTLNNLLTLNIENNSLKCDCDLEWIKNFLNNQKSQNLPKCRYNSTWKGINEFEFCPESIFSTYSDELVPTLPSTEGKNSTEYIFLTIQCKNLKDCSSDDEMVTKNSIKEAVFKKRNINYVISETENGSSYIIRLKGDLQSTDYLIWTNTNDENDYGCVYELDDDDITMNLAFDTTYTICIASNDSTDSFSVIVEDCSALKTLPPWSERTLLYKNQELVLISSIIFSFIFTIILTVVVTYFIIKNKPQLIRSKKRVVEIGKEGHSDVSGIYSLNTCTDLPDRKPSALSLSTTLEGYLTPKMCTGKILHAVYEGMDYVRTAVENKYNDVYEAPPLPPNHPSERKK
ncbi:uncharacterized protein LOC115886682 [Sitophilus oryzae]|uniref:Uncharacterized protein LOC115886682 n=1 Tax=Sitophilus oryzae TaxID=7048 RepID=A0A6J2YFZ3_SITOR|nr:uncharacterized protein LOC115886682 [Sitophilus oryzae]XP_030761801.1 uncharacterized protein LOC115886682 [Sitophilus oryzae]